MMFLPQCLYSPLILCIDIGARYEEDNKNDFSSNPVKIPITIAVFKEWDNWKMIDERAELEKLSNEGLEKKFISIMKERKRRHPEWQPSPF